MGHSGTSGESFGDRMKRFGFGTAGENINYGWDLTGKSTLLSLAVDDGVKSRGHRKNIFNPAWKS